MKHQPYREIIDLSAELKEYRRLCKGKSRKFTYYSEWKRHMMNSISKLKDEEKMENMKHYYINLERSTKGLPMYYLEIMIVFVTILIDKVVDIKINYWAFIIMFLTFVLVTLLQKNSYTKEHNLYSDVISIIDEVEEKIS